MSLPRPEGIIFDFDGVLIESVDVKTRAFISLYSQYGPEVVEKVVAYHLEHGGVSRFEKFRHFHRAFLGKELGKDEGSALGARFSQLVEDAVVASPWVAGAREFLELHHEKIPMFIASGTPDPELKRITARRAMSHYFISIHGAPATKAEIIARILREQDLPSRKVLMVGDSMADYEGAVGAGARFVARITASSRAFPAGVPAIDDLTELPSLLSC